MAAWNEEPTIACTLDSVLKQDFPGQMEVLVCANGCTDKTAEVVRGYERKDPRVRLIETSERGKPNAWNILVPQAQSNYLVFTDADVYVTPGSVGFIYNRLKSGGKIGTTGLIIPFYNGSGYLARLLWPKPQKDFVSQKDHFSGGLYGINKRRLLERMQQFGLDKMPNDIIAEDFFLAVLIGEHNRDFESGAVAYHLAPNLVDFISTCSRNQRGRRQIAERFPELRDELCRIQNTYGRPALLDKGIYYLCRISESEDIPEAYRRGLSLLMKVLTRGLIQARASMGRIGTLQSEWCVAKSTKKTIDPAKINS